MTQGQAVARLNVLAFAFLPLSWVAVSLSLLMLVKNGFYSNERKSQTIFGLTQFSISAVWYPLGAFIVLIVTVLVPFTLPVHGLYHYMLGLSAPHWLKRKLLAPIPGIDENTTELPSRSAQASVPMGRLGMAYQPDVRENLMNVPSANAVSHRIVGAVHPRPAPHNSAVPRRKSSPRLSQAAGPPVNYTPMFASLQTRGKSTSNPAPTSSVDTAARETPVTAAENTASILPPFELSSSTKQSPTTSEDDEKLRTSDIEAQRS